MQVKDFDISYLFFVIVYKTASFDLYAPLVLHMEIESDIRVINSSEWRPQEEFNENFDESGQMFVLHTVCRLIAEKTLM